MQPMKFLRPTMMTGMLIFGGIPTMTFAQTAYLEITLNVAAPDRPAAAAVYSKYKQPFLTTVKVPPQKSCSCATRTYRCFTASTMSPTPRPT
jgi:hypothetical protein